MRSILPVALSFALASTQAQLVFIPDVEMRTWFNELVPGCVDGSGYLDTANPPLEIISNATLSVDWSPSDLTGLEYLTYPGFDLTVYYYVGGPTTIPAWPPEMDFLELHEYPGTTLTPLPSSLLTLGLVNCQAFATMPALPAGLQALDIRQNDLITTIDPLPSSLEGLWLTGMPSLSALPVLPTGLHTLNADGLPIAALPALPSLCYLYLQNLPNLTTPLPPLLMADDCNDQMQGTNIIYIDNCPLLPEPTGAWVADWVYLRGLPWTVLPTVTGYSVAVMHVEGLPLVAVAPVPQNIRDLYLNDLSIPSLDLPDGLEGLDSIDVAITSLDALPATLRHLQMTNCPQLSSIADAPADLETLYASVCPSLVALPPLASTNLVELHLLELPTLADLPNLPDNLNAFELHQLPLIDSINVDFDQFQAGLINSQWSVIDMTALSFIKELPSAEVWPWIINCPELQCMCAMPDELMELTIQNTGVTCLPNYPSSWFPNNITPPLPLCNIFTSACEVIYPQVMGEVFNDTNANGVLDTGEEGYPGQVLEAGPGGFLTSSDGTGWFAMAVDTATYTVNVMVPLYHICTTAPQEATLGSYTAIDTVGPIGLHPLPGITDLVADVTSAAPALIGLEHIHHLTAHNVGTTGTDATFTYTFDPVFQWINAVPPPDQLNGNVAQWNTTAFPPGASWSAEVELMVALGTPLGTPLSSSLVATPAVTDTTPSNNVSTLDLNVVGSFDPNDKTVEPATLSSAEVAEGARLNYTIRFQNTGNYPAWRVVITDTLSSDLQWNTMQLVSNSHPCTWYIHYGVLHFVFDPIDLPDSTNNEPESHGFVKFSMLPVNTLLNGAQIPNVANIVFDFNAPVITPPAIFTVDDASIVVETSQGAIIVYPNPAHDVLVVETPEAIYQRVAVLDMLGRPVLTARVTGARTELPTAALPAGTYLLRLQGPNDVRSLQFLRE